MRAEAIAEECETVKGRNDRKREIARLTIECEKKQEKPIAFNGNWKYEGQYCPRSEENNVYRIQLETFKSDGEKLRRVWTLRKEKEKLEELKAQLLEANSEINAVKLK